MNKVRVTYNYASPTRWTKLSTIRDLLVWNTAEISSFCVHGITPPLLNGVQSDCSILWILQSKEDDDNTSAITDL
jgi:hypothetical protein